MIDNHSQKQLLQNNLEDNRKPFFSNSSKHWNIKESLWERVLVGRMVIVKIRDS